MPWVSETQHAILPDVFEVKRESLSQDAVVIRGHDAVDGRGLEQFPLALKVLWNRHRRHSLLKQLRDLDLQRAGLIAHLRLPLRAADLIFGSSEPNTVKRLGDLSCRQGQVAIRSRQVELIRLAGLVCKKAQQLRPGGKRRVTA